MDGQVSWLGTVHPLLTLNFISTWIIPLHVMSRCVFDVEEEVVVIRNGWTPKKIVYRHIHVPSDISLNNQLKHICKMHNDMMLLPIKYCPILLYVIPVVLTAVIVVVAATVVCIVVIANVLVVDVVVMM